MESKQDKVKDTVRDTVRETLKQQNKYRMEGIVILVLLISIILLFFLFSGKVPSKIVAITGLVIAIVTVVACKRCITEFNRVLDLERPTEKDENTVIKYGTIAFFCLFLEIICLLVLMSMI